MCSTKSFCANFTANDDSQKKRKEDQLQSLETDKYFRAHWLTRDKLLCDTNGAQSETNLSVRKKGAQSFRKDLEKTQIDVPQKKMTLHCNCNKFLSLNNCLFTLQIKLITYEKNKRH